MSVRLSKPKNDRLVNISMEYGKRAAIIESLYAERKLTEFIQFFRSTVYDRGEPKENSSSEENTS